MVIARQLIGREGDVGRAMTETAGSIQDTLLFLFKWLCDRAPIRQRERILGLCCCRLDSIDIAASPLRSSSSWTR